MTAILLSCMEVSNCTSGFFCSYNVLHVAKKKNSLINNFVKRELPFPRGLKSCMHIGYRVVNHAVTIMCADRTE